MDIPLHQFATTVFGQRGFFKLAEKGAANDTTESRSHSFDLDNPVGQRPLPRPYVLLCTYKCSDALSEVLENQQTDLGTLR